MIHIRIICWSQNGCYRGERASVPLPAPLPSAPPGCLWPQKAFFCSFFCFRQLVHNMWMDLGPRETWGAPGLCHIDCSVLAPRDDTGDAHVPRAAGLGRRVAGVTASRNPANGAAPWYGSTILAGPRGPAQNLPWYCKVDYSYILRGTPSHPVPTPIQLP